MVTAAIIRMVTIPPQGLGPHSPHPSPNLHHQQHQEKGPETPGPLALVPALAPLMVVTAITIVRMGKRVSRERGKSTETGHGGRPQFITRTGGGRSIMMIGEVAETSITMT